MEKLRARIRILTLIAGLLMLTGFIIFTQSPNNIVVAVAFNVVAIALLMVALVCALKLYQLEKEQKDDRIKKLEEEVELLKKR
jgi:divalent metal cation (Fe/Co/Zn/Cd) transporter